MKRFRRPMIAAAFPIVLFAPAYGGEQTASKRADREYQRKAGPVALSKVRDSAARGEYESFQVSIIPLRNREVRITGLAFSGLEEVGGNGRISADAAW